MVASLRIAPAASQKVPALLAAELSGWCSGNETWNCNHPTGGFLSGIPFRFIPFLILYRTLCWSNGGMPCEFYPSRRSPRTAGIKELPIPSSSRVGQKKTVLPIIPKSIKSRNSRENKFFVLSHKVESPALERAKADLVSELQPYAQRCCINNAIGEPAPLASNLGPKTPSAEFCKDPL